MAVEMTLAEKLGAVMRAEEFYNPVDKGAALPFGLPGKRSDLEIDARDWTMYYGIAVGLARTEEPCEPIQSVVVRARTAACEVFADLNGSSSAMAEA